MNISELLLARSGNKCELCSSEAGLQAYELKPGNGNAEESTVFICPDCTAQVEGKTAADSDHWRKCLPAGMWSEVAGIQVLSWRMLSRFKAERWAADCLEMMYLDEARLAWAASGINEESTPVEDFHQDSNGQLLVAGDTVVLTRSLEIKGSPLNAKMGTVVKNIRLVSANTDQIEGKIEGSTIVILTKYVRKH